MELDQAYDYIDAANGDGADGESGMTTEQEADYLASLPTVGE